MKTNENVFPRRYLVTGAAGHLGNTIVRKLLEKDRTVRALLLPGEAPPPSLEGAEIFTGDVRNEESLSDFFSQSGESDAVIHCAGIVSVASGHDRRIRDVNVSGTENIISWCRRLGVGKLVHVSSVHAIPEKPKGEMISETDQFDPALVKGIYAKTKAEATKKVLDAAAQGLNASVVHPSGIFGPYDYRESGHITQLFRDYLSGGLSAIVKGGYDFVDVRDAAEGTISCVSHGKRGECYILSGNYLTIPELAKLFYEATGLRRVKTVLPMWLAKVTAPLSEAYYKILHQPPLYTPYSLYTLTSNSRFDRSKAMRELGYKVRNAADTIRDMAQWTSSSKKIITAT